ncbi:MAG TPA: threonine/serine exporter family protein [Flexivirga sp.]|uniref:threonine/serine exporter family protein n=1 Tax=Flexivirga sp. TaxID=1962927 RepID=UPI002B693B83|nr:threonine/serine exporter family protein [Flexivirga sp.]HWC21090.1 threonine/serine exporter family protein [Flexivirga sp.]
MGVTIKPTPDDPGRGDERKRLLLEVGAALLGGGAASSDVEDELRALSPVIGCPEITVAALPTGLFLGLEPMDSVSFAPVDSAVRLDQTSEVLVVISSLRARDLTVSAALRRLQEIRETAPRWPRWVGDLGGIPIGIGLCLLLQPGTANLLVVAACSLTVAGLTMLTRRWRSLARLLPVTSAFVTSLIVLGAFHAGWVDGPLRLVVAAIAILLPGSAIVIGLTEIASGAAAAGTSRLVSGGVQIALFVSGLVAAAALTRTPLSSLSNGTATHPAWWAAVLGIAICVVGLMIHFFTPVEHALAIAVVMGAAGGTQVPLTSIYNPEVGGFAAALAAMIAAIIVSWLPGGPVWRITYVPAFLIVAPGSFGLLNASQVEIGSGTSRSLLTALSAFLAIAVGTLIGSIIARAADHSARSLPATTDAVDWPAGE